MKILFLVMLFGVAVCFGQEEGTSKYFRLEFTVKELHGGKVTNARSYTMSVTSKPGDGGPNGSIRAEEKVSFTYGLPNSGQTLSENVGVSVDCRQVKEVGDRLALQVNSTVESLAPPEKEALPPIIRKMQWSAYVLIPLKKTVTIFSSDEPSSKDQMQMDVLATPIN